jgi:hypothetical protein
MVPSTHQFLLIVVMPQSRVSLLTVDRVDNSLINESNLVIGRLLRLSLATFSFLLML